MAAVGPAALPIALTLQEPPPPFNSYFTIIIK